MARDFYDLLGVEADASQGAIERAYRERAREYHPDVNDHPRAREQFTVLTTARDVLTDPDERTQYDELGHDEFVSAHLDAVPTPGMDPETDADASADDVAVSDVEETAESVRTGDSGTSGFGSRFTPGGAERPTGGGSGGTGTDATSGVRSPPSDGPTTESEASADGGSTGGGVSWERSRRRQAARTRRTRGHLTASFHWIPLVLATVLYGFGLGRYLRVNRAALAGVGDESGGIISLLAAVHGRAGVQTSLEFVYFSGMRISPDVSFGAVFLVGAVAFGFVTLWSVWTLRRTTNWSPSWLHATCAFGPAVSLVLASAVDAGGASVGVPVLPLWLDLLLLVGFPTIAVSSYLLNRFVLVLPLVRETE